MPPRIRLYLSLFVALFVANSRASQTDAKIQIDEDSGRIITVSLSDSSVMARGVIIYPVGGDWMLPLAELAETLGLAVTAFPTLSKAAGFVLQESRKFSLDMMECKVTYEGRAESYECGKALVHREDIYLHRSLFQKWFPVDIEVDSLRSQLTVTPREKLPNQSRQDRERLASRSKGLSSAYDPGYPRVEIPYTLWEGPVIDQDLMLTRRAAADDVTHSLQYNTQIGGEVMGLEAASFFTGNENKLLNWRLQLARKSAEGELLGPLGVREARFFDFGFPALPLLSRGRPGRGMFLSSFPLDQPSNFENTDIEGFLQPGWEVVLYRNDILLDRQIIDQSGRYFFRAVPLFYGRNVFRLSFFGPHGEREDKYKTFNLAPELLRPGEHHYRIAMGVLDDSTHRVSLQYAENLSKYFTVSGGMLTDRGSADSFGYLGVVGVNELFFFSSNCAFATGGGAACEWGEQMGIGEITVGGKFTRIFGLKSEMFAPRGDDEQISQTTGNLAYIIPTLPAVGMNWEFIKRDFASGVAQTQLRNRLSVSAGSINLNNELNYFFDSSVPVTGRWFVTVIPSALSYRLGVDYLGGEVKSFDFETQYTNNEFSFGTYLKYQLDGTTRMRLTASRYLESFIFGANGEMGTGGAFSVNAFLSFSLARDPRDDSTNFSRFASVSQGSASVLVFVDKNRNGIREREEIVLPGMFIVVNQRDLGIKTNDEGIALIKRLAPHSPTDISLSHRSLEDPFLRPAQPGIRFVPRPSKSAQIDLPMVVVGAADGSVMIQDATTARPKKGMLIEVLDERGEVVSKGKTDFDGIFSVDGIAPGQYTARVSSAQLRSLGLSASPSTRVITIAEEGSFETGVDFLLRSIANTSP